MSVGKQTLTAVVRASRPAFRCTLVVPVGKRATIQSKHDRVAFVVHAFMLSDDYKLVATGTDAENTEDAKEVGTEGWKSLRDCYAFQYVDVSGKRDPLCMKAVVLGSNLLVHWLIPSRQDPPKSLSLDIHKYTTDSSDLSQGYQNLDELSKRLHATLLEHNLSTSKQSSSPAQARASTLEDPVEVAGTSSQQGSDRTPFIPRIGGEDVVPPGFRPPGIGPGPFGPEGLPGLMQPGGGGGGMHMGPHDPLFAGRARPSGQGSLPPGARWDPIRPPGMEGFSPGDFQRQGRSRGRGVHPDIAQPGPGTTDWESMYG